MESSFIEALRGLRARDGSVAILGNHDYLTDVKLVRRCISEGGVTELINGVRTLRRGGAVLHVAGIDDTASRALRYEPSAYHADHDILSSGGRHILRIAYSLNDARRLRASCCGASVREPSLLASRVHKVVGASIPRL
jgi:predicted MPP superfamily phosphohydrolase